jgi:hypothetical protein
VLVEILPSKEDDAFQT